MDSKKRDPALEGRIKTWISSLIHESFPAGPIEEALKNGVILCKLANALRAGSVPRIYEGPLPFKQMENIANYIQACESLGLPPRERFQTVDLFEQKDLNQVFINLNALMRTFNSSAPKPKQVVITISDTPSPLASSSSSPSSSSSSSTPLPKPTPTPTPTPAAPAPAASAVGSGSKKGPSPAAAYFAQKAPPKVPSPVLVKKPSTTQLPASAPATKAPAPAPAPATKAPTPAPVVKSPTPAPAPTPAPVVKSPTPAPAPTPAPVVKSPTPAATPLVKSPSTSAQKGAPVHVVKIPSPSSGVNLSFLNPKPASPSASSASSASSSSSSSSSSSDSNHGASSPNSSATSPSPNPLSKLGKRTASSGAVSPMDGATLKQKIRRNPFFAENSKAADVTSLDSDISTKQLFKYDPAMEEAAREWIENVLQIKMPNPNSLHQSLRDGVLLCELINKIKPGTVAKIGKGKISFVHMENIESFIKGCVSLGLKQSSLFNTLDLYEEKNMNLVITSIHVLAKLAPKVPTYTGPKIRQVEASTNVLSTADLVNFSAIENDDSPISGQEKELLDWMNSHLKHKNTKVDRLRKDCHKGLALIYLLEQLTGTSKIGVYQTQPVTLWHCMQNAAIVLKFVSQQIGQKVLFCTGHDITLGKQEPIIKLVTLIREKFDRDFVFKSQNLTEDSCRIKIIEELLETERTYIRMMKEVDSIVKTINQNEYLPEEETQSVFSNISVILQEHEQLLADLEARFASQQSVGPAFSSRSNWADQYSVYINSFDMGPLMLKYNMKKYKDFKKYIKGWEKTQKELSGLDLASFLILPVQRLPRYLLLFKELIKYTPDSHAEFESINHAIQVISDALEDINNRKRNADNSSLKLLGIDKAMSYDHCEGFEGIVHPKRKYVLEGPLAWEENEVDHPYWFLFNDILVYCEQLSEEESRSLHGKLFKYITLIPLIFVEDVTGSDDKVINVTLEDDVISLEAESTEVRDRWLEAIKNTAELKVDLDLVW